MPRGWRSKLGMQPRRRAGGAGVGSAFGFLRAPIAYEVVRTRHVRLDALDAKTTERRLFAAMRAEAEAVVRLGAPAETLVETRTGFMRYRGQGHEIAVPLPDQRARRRCRAATCAAASMRPMTRVFGRVIPRLEVEALTWTLSLADRTAAAQAGCRCRRRPAPRRRPSGIAR